VERTLWLTWCPLDFPGLLSLDPAGRTASRLQRVVWDQTPCWHIRCLASEPGTGGDVLCVTVLCCTVLRGCTLHWVPDVSACRQWGVPGPAADGVMLQPCPAFLLIRWC
jgi:hypothetical protein